MGYACGGENEPDLARCYFCRKELDGWDPEDDPWAEHVSHAKGKCAFVNLGKKASELTVADVLGVLEPAKNGMVLTKVEEMWEAQFTEEATATRRDRQPCAEVWLKNLIFHCDILYCLQDIL